MTTRLALERRKLHKGTEAKMFFSRKQSGKKTIKFVPDSPRAERILQSPTPAYKNVPEWYKRLSKYTVSDVKFSRLPTETSGPNDTNLTAKACKPFLDSFTVGYIITLPTDVSIVDPDIYGTRIIWDSNTNMVDAHSALQINGLSVPEEYEPSPYKWNFHWAIEVPDGYSLIYTHPFNRVELPFHTLTGVVDSDVYGAPVNLPFFLRKDFTGVLPIGTPVAQVIPIKREDWTHSIGTCEDYDPFTVERIKLHMSGGYKKMYWKPKNYR